jgi:REP element-mobilizing transposase RayT
MTEHIIKDHNKTLLLYHLVFPVKYRKKIFTDEVENTLVSLCTTLSNGYEIHFVEIGIDHDHVHFLIQSVPTLSITKIVTIIKSITAKELFIKHPNIKKLLWGGNIWSSGYYANTVGKYNNEKAIREYIQQQGKDSSDYKIIHKDQLTLFTGLV